MSATVGSPRVLAEAAAKAPKSPNRILDHFRRLKSEVASPVDGIWSAIHREFHICPQDKHQNEEDEDDDVHGCEFCCCCRGGEHDSGSSSSDSWS
uniref:Uncharacterized protein n=1 Tax=Romanomermis culicivorax TaxID=13658 RepID=A0A915HG87_ROMCU